ncbi:MAG: translation initiation factor IF-2 [Flavobacteriales bacterium]|nr:translation initiation factor IF-2 [Flavobacteriales bacterium]
MSEVKAQRLGKAAVEFGVSKETIIDFLAKKGFGVDNNPMTKIEPEAVLLLQGEFQIDQAAKEKIAATSNKIRESHKSVSLEDMKGHKTEEKEEEQEDEGYKKVLEEAKKQKAASNAKVEAKTKEVKPAEPKAAVTPAETASPEVAEKEVSPEPPVKKEEEAPAKHTMKVVGQIDPATLEKPKKGKKKKEEEEAAAIAEKADKAEKAEKAEKAKKKTSKKLEDTPQAETVEKTEAPVAVEVPKAPAPPEQELIRVKVEKLSGVKLMGRIELPVEPEKKKPETAAQRAEGEKRKRKRVAKVDIQRQQEIDKRQRPKPTTPIPGVPKPAMDEAAIQNQVRETLARLGNQGKSKSSKFRREKRDNVARKAEEQLIRDQEESSILKLTEFVTVSELATMMNKSAAQIIAACMSLGIFASINQRLDAETIHIIAEEFGFQIEFVSAELTDTIAEEADLPEDLTTRPPVVTVMGHVDHGKTSLLDFIRKSTVVAGEAGGITQHIGAYSVTLSNGRKITFLDTPGHEAFTAMRARGAQVTDLAIIVIAADDSVMPQTKEAISHAQAASVPMIFAINKIDKDGAQPDRIREQLSQMNILVESWGGKFQDQEIAAKQGLNVELLLEKVLLESDMLELKANAKKRAIGTIIESSLDKGRGYTSTVLVESGTLKIGDALLAGQFSGRVKAMFNERGQKIEEAGPATPVSLLGFEGAPNAGDKFNVMEDEREARNIAVKRGQLQRAQSVRTKKHLTIEEIGRRIALGDFKELNLIVKGDVDGSVEALTDSLQKLSTEKIQVRIIHKGVGQISESDVLLASASDAIIVGFQVRPSLSARRIAETEEIQIKLYSIIYKAIEEVKEAMEGLLSTRIEERVIGTAEIRDVFKISKVGTVAGGFMLDGKIARTSKIRVIREGIVIFSGELGSLKRFKDDVKEVQKGYECGLNVEKFNDIQVGDLIEGYEEVEVKQTL